jgi:GDP/UDP-N,N'-diacetylbacillosamine 2-epimerase (hydrolysing)
LIDVKNPYGDGCASQKVKESLKNVSLDGMLKKSFYDVKVNEENI